jgi:hypothetical protein
MMSPKINVLFTISFATNDRFAHSKSLWHISCWILCSLFNGVNYAVEAKRNDSIAMNLATPSNFRAVRCSVARHCWPLRGLYTPLRPPGSSQRHRRHRVDIDITHGCGWLKARIW